jgi:hypothetical protein
MTFCVPCDFRKIPSRNASSQCRPEQYTMTGSAGSSMADSSVKDFKCVSKGNETAPGRCPVSNSFADRASNISNQPDSVCLRIISGYAISIPSAAARDSRRNPWSSIHGIRKGLANCASVPRTIAQSTMPAMDAKAGQVAGGL